MPDKIKLAEKFQAIDAPWQPKIAASFNGQDLKLAKFHGEFPWHRHLEEDEMFLVLKGEIVIRLREGDVSLSEGEAFVVPKGVEHAPMAEEEAWVVMLEPAGTVNTGDQINDRTVLAPERI